MAESGEEPLNGAAALPGPAAVQLPETLDARWYAAEVATFGDRLAGARERAGLSQDELAQRLGVRLTTLQAWEDDLAEPRGNRLTMLAGLLNVSLSWLLTAQGEGVAAPDQPEASAPILTPQLRAALADLTLLSNRATALAVEVAKVEKRIQRLLRQE